MSKLQVDSMLKTPDKKLNISSSFSPIGTSNRELTGPSKTAYTHSCTFNSYVENWNSLQKKGLLLCRTIQALKLHEIIGGGYPSQLVSLCDSLLEATNGMEHVIEGMQTLSKQLNALAKLCSTPEAIVNTWSASKLAVEVETCTHNYTAEHQLKKVVTENIAHCREECLTQAYVSSWEYNIYIDNATVDFILAEMGLTAQIQ